MTTMPGELPHDESPDPFVQFGPGGMALLSVCKTAAVAGALVFTALVVMSVVSITGRKLWSAPGAGRRRIAADVLGVRGGQLSSPTAT